MKHFLFLIVLWGSIVQLPAQKLERIQFSKDTAQINCKFLYSDWRTCAYLDSLRTLYRLDTLISGCQSDLEKAMTILDWTSKRWNHHSYNRPVRYDAISILKEAEEGKNFRCVEYGIVLAATLNAIGIPARTLGLKTKDVETRKYGAGHVVTEAYLSDLKKWVVLDGQKNMIPLLDGIPLNAVELNFELNNNRRRVDFANANGLCSGRAKRRYIKWIGQYLYYFDTSFDHRYGVNGKWRKCNGKANIMLVPHGAKNPVIFEIKHQLDYCRYTHNLDYFYRAPQIL